MNAYHSLDDDKLLELTSSDPEMFGLFYRRHVNAIASYFMYRTRDSELSADLTAEVFAAALAARKRYKPGKKPAKAWLYAIAEKKLIDSYRRGKVDNKARLKIGMECIEIEDADLQRIEEIASQSQYSPIREMVMNLPCDQRRAVEARFVDQFDYAEIAKKVSCSESVIRKRVSRGLTAVRNQVKEGGR